MSDKTPPPRPHYEPGPDHPITVEPCNDRVTVIAAGAPVAATVEALCLREKGYDTVHYIARDFADKAALVPSDHVTWCPYKGEASYFHIQRGETMIENAVWSYETPFPAVRPIAGHLAFDRQKATIAEEALSPVSGQAVQILSYWFEELTAEQHFKRDEAVDDEIEHRFGALHRAAVKQPPEDWLTTSDGALALVILLDQFSRNLHRNSPRAFAADDTALGLARRAIALGHDLVQTGARRAFFYMPHMHAEDLEAQEDCVRLFKARMPGSKNIPFAEEHRDIIARFGRFPHRNEVLGRETTPEEQAFMDDGGASFA